MNEVTEETVRVWVASREELYVYEPVTRGRAEDIGMAYDLTITPTEKPPADGQTVEVRDLVGLDEVRAQLGLYRPNLISDVLNAAWRVLRADKGTPRTRGVKERVYRVEHRKHGGGFF